MYIHIGKNEIINNEEIICVLDYHIVHTSSKYKRFIKNKKDNTIWIDHKKNIKSIIVTNDKIFYSPLLPRTLKNREDIFKKAIKLDIENEQH